MTILPRRAVALVAGAIAFALSSCSATSNSATTTYNSESQWIVIPNPSAILHQLPEVPTRVVSFETTEGTFMNVDVSPDGETLVFDLLGDIYQLPIEGGDAVSLTTGTAWDQAPRFSPEGAHVYFVSDRVGYKNLWRLTLADRSLRQITSLERDIVGGPNWSQDGNRLLAGVTTEDADSPDIVLQSIDPIDGTMTPINAPVGPWIDTKTFKRLRSRVKTYSGVESADGKVFFSEALPTEDFDRWVVRLYEFDRLLQTRIAIASADAVYHDFKPQLSHNGNLLAYYRQYNDRRTELRILNLAIGQDEALVSLADADDAVYTQSDDSRPNYAFAPDDLSIFLWHAGKIRRAKLTGGVMEVVPFRVDVERKVTKRVQPACQKIDDVAEATAIRWPSLARNRQAMVFTAIGYVWVMDLQTGAVRRLTNSTDFEYMPALSPDGKSIAYISFAHSGDAYGPGRLMIAGIDDGRPREVLPDPNHSYLLPKWSPDGSRIALIRETDGKSGANAVFGWTSAETGTFHEVAVVPAPNDRRATYHIYARRVAFDAAGERLFFSYPRSLTETVLAAADLVGGSPQILAIGASDVGGITPAPDLKNVALTHHDGSVWVIPFDVGEEPTLVSSLVKGARRVSENGGYYVDWNGGGHLSFGFAQKVYRYRLQDGELQSRHVSVPLTKPKAEKPIAFTGARLVTLSDEAGAEPVIESGTVIVDGARIAAIGSASAIEIPSNALVIDATGTTIMPGYLDTHYHGIGSSFSGFAFPNPNFSDESAITFGITTAWEPGGAMDDGVPALVDLQAAGRITGPRWSHAAIGVVGYPYQYLIGRAAALSAVARHRDLGVTVLKEYLAPTRQQRQWLLAAAHKLGLGIVSHLQSYDGMMTRIVDGYTGGDHPSIPMPFYKDVYELLRQTSYIWTPNADITYGSIGNQNVDAAKFFYCDAIIRKQEQGDLGDTEIDSICKPNKESPTLPYDAHRVSVVARQAALAASNGVHIGVSAHSMPGFNLHREMWLLWRGGMPIEEVLRATTIGNAAKLGLHTELGSLEVGKIADFLVLYEDPLDDILNTLSLKYTVQGGVVYNSTTADRVDVWEIALAQKGETLH